MMKIQSIEITNYKAFLEPEELRFRGKNVFIYGENGSGKSSLYYALKDFFQSSVENIDFAVLENVFTEKVKQGSGKISVTLKPEGGNRDSGITYHASVAGNHHGIASDTLVRDTNKLKTSEKFSFQRNHGLSPEDLYSASFPRALVLFCSSSVASINSHSMAVISLRNWRFSAGDDTSKNCLCRSSRCLAFFRTSLSESNNPSESSCCTGL